MESSFEHVKSKWLSGRGTKVLYLALLLGIFGGVGTGQALAAAHEAEARAVVEQQTAVQNARALAEHVVEACKDANFAKTHTEVCVQAADVAADPAVKTSAGAGDVLETLGLTR